MTSCGFPPNQQRFPRSTRNRGKRMHDIYMEDQDYDRLINFMLDSVVGTLLGESARDQLVIALGERARIWPQSTREAETT